MIRRPLEDSFKVRNGRPVLLGLARGALEHSDHDALRHHQPKATAAAEHTRLVTEATGGENVYRNVSRTKQNSEGVEGTDFPLQR